MKCSYCGSEIADDSKTCAVCGADLRNIFTEKLIRDALQGNQEAMAELYNQTYNSVYQTVKVIIRTDEDAVLDIVQDTYIRAFRYLNQLDQPENFRAWIKRIAANTAKNYLKKKKPVLFSEMSTEDDEAPELRFEDDRLENQPEAVVEQKETTRLINEILDSLSDEQRIALVMFYFNEMSVKEIAEEMGCSESTVKSRLNYGRQKVKFQVEELEKKGTKLYSLAPIPFLLFLFRSTEAHAASLPDTDVLAAVQKSIASEMTASSSVGTVETTGRVIAKTASKSVGKSAAGMASETAGKAAAGAAGKAVVHVAGAGAKLAVRKIAAGVAAAVVAVSAAVVVPQAIKTERTSEAVTLEETTAASIESVTEFESAGEIETSKETGSEMTASVEIPLEETSTEESVGGITETDKGETDKEAEEASSEESQETELTEIESTTEEPTTEESTTEEPTTKPAVVLSLDEIREALIEARDISKEEYLASQERYDEEYAFLGEGIMYVLHDRELGIYTVEIGIYECDINEDGKEELLLGRFTSPSRVDAIAVYYADGTIDIGEDLERYELPLDLSEDGWQFQWGRFLFE